MGKRGEKLRPCHRCAVLINFVPWEEKGGRAKGMWHWANEDGTHHFCRTQAAEINDAAAAHIRAIVEGD